MRTNFRHFAGALVVAAGLAVGGGAVHAAAAPLLQGQVPAPDYTKNKTYQQGVREGQQDRTHNRDHSKKRHFKKDDDQKAYEAGYQQGRGN